MTLFSKKRHKLPTYPKTIKQTFKEYCVNVDEERLKILREKVNEELEDAQKRVDNGGIHDLKMANEIANRCFYLLDNYNNFLSNQQKLIVGAVCYFAISDDPISEEIFASGYDDDAQVINYVLEELGIDDMYIDLVE